MLRKLGKSNRVAILKEIADATYPQTKNDPRLCRDNRIVLEPKASIAKYRTKKDLTNE